MQEVREAVLRALAGQPAFYPVVGYENECRFAPRFPAPTLSRSLLRSLLGLSTGASAGASVLLLGPQTPLQMAVLPHRARRPRPRSCVQRSPLRTGPSKRWSTCTAPSRGRPLPRSACCVPRCRPRQASYASSRARCSPSTAHLGRALSRDRGLARGGAVAAARPRPPGL